MSPKAYEALGEGTSEKHMWTQKQYAPHMVVSSLGSLFGACKLYLSVQHVDSLPTSSFQLFCLLERR